jgi:hypothetical protein
MDQKSRATQTQEHDDLGLATPAHREHMLAAVRSRKVSSSSCSNAPRGEYFSLHMKRDINNFNRSISV